jgi:hypothetical protein
MNTGINNWSVRLQGAASDLEHLALYFASPPARVIKDSDDESYLLLQDSFDTCRTSDEVHALAVDQASILSGILTLVRQSRESLRVGAVYKQHPNGTKEIFLCAREILQVTDESTAIVTDAKGNVITSSMSVPRTVALSALAVRDASVAKAMRLIAASDASSWVGMYRLYEIIEANMGGERSMQDLNCGSRDVLKRFKHSANSVAIAGDAARHGKECGLPPSNPMSFEEAGAYLNYLLETWLASKST